MYIAASIIWFKIFFEKEEKYAEFVKVHRNKLMCLWFTMWSLFETKEVIYQVKYPPLKILNKVYNLKSDLKMIYNNLKNR